MSTQDKVTHAIKMIDQATVACVNAIAGMSRLSDLRYGRERDQIIMTIGRLRVLSSKINKENLDMGDHGWN